MNLRRAVLLVAALVFITTGMVLYRSDAVRDTTTARDYEPGLPADSAELVAMVVGKYRPEFSLPDVAGQLRHISEWDGQVVTLNFWATWCLPCLKEVPELVDLQARFGSQGLQIVGIALQRPEELGGFIAENKMNYPVLAGEAAVIVVAELYGNTVGVLPYTAIINRTGEIVFTRAGPVTGAEVEAVISKLL